MTTCLIRCHGCGETIDSCYYGGDCLEVRAIYREQQREKLADIIVEDLHDCPFCGCPSDNRNGCYSCVG